MSDVIEMRYFLNVDNVTLRYFPDLRNDNNLIESNKNDLICDIKNLTERYKNIHAFITLSIIFKINDTEFGVDHCFDNVELNQSNNRNNLIKSVIKELHYRIIETYLSICKK